MFNSSYGSIEISKKVIEVVQLIKSNWLFFKKDQLIRHENNYENKSPTPGIEPGPAGWKPAILAIRPRGTSWGEAWLLT